MTRASRRRLGAVLLVVFMLAQGWPMASATHLNDAVGLALPQPSDFIPLTGQAGVDDVTGLVGDAADAFADIGRDAVTERTAEPQVPATYYRDDLFGPGRIGGWGTWMAQTASLGVGAGWSQGALHAGDGRTGIAFGDSVGYAVGPSQLDHYLMSPRISLDALPSDTMSGDAAGDQVLVIEGIDGADRTVTAPGGEIEAIKLELTHRHHLGCQDVMEGGHATVAVIQAIHDHTHRLCDGTNGEGEIKRTTGTVPGLSREDMQGDGTDHARVLLFLDTPPSATDLMDPDRYIALSHKDEQPDSAGMTRFTGQRPGFTTTAFDLTSYAGRDAWLVFHVQTAPNDFFHFQRSTQFDLDVPFYGWQIDSVVIEGPAYLDNTKIDQLLNPHSLVGQPISGALLVAPGADQDDLAMVVLNRGQRTATVKPSLTLDDGDTLESFVAPTITLVPGETRAVLFTGTRDFLADKNDEVWTATFSVTPVSGERDAYIQDNTVRVDLLVGRDTTVRLARLPDIDPVAADANTERTARIALENAGPGRETVDVEIFVEYHQGKALPANPGDWQDVTALSIVAGAASQTVTLEAGESRELAWGLTLAQAGLYQFRVMADVWPPPEGGPAPPSLEGSVLAATLIDLPAAFQTDFQNLDGWSAVHDGDSMPPCAAATVPCDRILEMPTTCTDACKTLVGRVDLDDENMLVFDSKLLIASLRLEVTQWTDLIYDDADRTGRHAVELWFGEAAYEIVRKDTLLEGLLSGGRVEGVLDPNEPNAVLQDYRFSLPTSPQSHPANRLDAYAGSWRTESYSLSADALIKAWQQEELERCLPFMPCINTGSVPTVALGAVPLAALDDRLSIRLSGSSASGCDDFMIASKWDCPLWRVAQARLVAVDVLGRDVEILLWNGRQDETIGTWDYSLRSGTLLSGTVPGAGLGWITREVGELNPGDTGTRRFNDTGPWQRFAAWGDNSGVWTTALPGTDLTPHDWRSFNMQAGMLISPPIDAPPGDEYFLHVSHWFNLLNSNGVEDRGTIHVRFVDGDGTPSTDWMLVATRFDHDHLTPEGLGRQRHAFTGNDCAYYQRTSCDATNPLRPPAHDAIPLSKLPLLDYHGLDVPVGADRNDPDSQALRIVDVRDGSTLWPVGAPSICDGACRFQVGFRVQTGTHASSQYNETEPVGWFIDAVKVIAATPSSYDLAVTDVDLMAGYDWTMLGLGPGDDEVRLNVTLENRGLFLLPGPNGSIWLNITRQDGATGALHFYPETKLDGGKVINGLVAAPAAADRATTVELPVEMPSTPGLYRFLVRVRIDGEVLAGLPVEDNVPENDCMGIILDAGDVKAVPTCNIDGVNPPLTVQAAPRLSVELDVVPRAGRSGPVPREGPITIENTGNVPVEGFRVERTQSHAKGGSTSRSWNLSTPLETSASASLVELLGRLQQEGLYEIDLQQDYYLTFDRVGRYEVNLCLRLAADDADCHATDKMFIESQETFFADSFDGEAVRHSAVTLGDILPANATGPWNLVQGEGTLGASGAWYFGDHLRRQYPANVDESLMLPPLDLSSASRASVAIVHKHDFEDAFDGARLEVSLNNGESWRPLHPDPRPGASAAGYPGLLASSNPMNPTQDPRQTTPAWTGTSDWITSEFDLGQIPELITDVLLYKIDLEDLHPAGNVFKTRTAPGEDDSPIKRATFGTKWVHPGPGTCSDNVDANPLMERCWYREDMHLGTPTANPAGDPAHDGEYWWSGYGCDSKCTSKNKNTFWPTYRLGLNLSLPETTTGGAGVVPRLSFWLWSDDDARKGIIPTTIGNVADFNGGFYVNHFNGTHWSNTTESLDVTFIESVAGGWRKYYVDLDEFQMPQGNGTKDVVVEFRFDFNRLQELGGGGNFNLFRQRGVVLDNARLDLAHGTSDAVVPGYSLGFPTDDVAWHHLPMIQLGSTPDPADLPGWPVDGGHWMARSPVGESLFDDDGMVPSSPPAWDIQTIKAPSGDEEQVFLFGDLVESPGGGQHFDYPTDARARLVTPVIDLRGVGGQQARAAFWESFRFHGVGSIQTPAEKDHLRQVWIQAIEPRISGDQPGPWVKIDPEGGPLGPASARDAYSTNMALQGCVVTFEGSPGWCERSLNLSSFIGAKVRLGFEIRTDSNQVQEGPGIMPACNQAVGGASLGCYWALHGLEVFAQTMAGLPLLMRLRAATDNSVGDGGWTVDDLQVVGFTYDDNVAIIPDNRTADYTVAPGSTLQLTGQVRNLGDGTGNIALQAAATRTAATPGTNPTLPTLDFGAGDGVPQGPFALGEAGRNNDARDYQLTVTVPETTQANGATYVIDLQVVEGELVPLPYVDENLGDHRRQVTIHVRTEHRIDLRVDDAIQPLTAEAGEPVTVRLTAANEGTVESRIEDLVITVTDPVSGEVVAESQSLATAGLLPGERETLSWQWTPPPGTQGLHRVDTVGWKPGPPDPVGLVLVGAKPIYYQEIFNADLLAESGWSSSQECNAESDCWRIRHDFAYAGDNSVYIGSDDPTSGTHNHRQDVRLTSPTVDLTSLGLLNLQAFRDSPFNPSLRFQYQGNLGENDGVVVEARRSADGQETWTRLDSPDYTGTLMGGETGNPLGAGAAFTGVHGAWRPATVPLGPADSDLYDSPWPCDHDCAEDEHKADGLVGQPIDLSFRFGSSVAGERGQAFTVDAVTVSSYASTLEPLVQAATLTTGADKEFHFRIENRGPATDTYQVRLSPDSNLNVFTAQVLTSSITLTPGSAGRVAVGVAAPSIDSGGGGGGSIVVDVQSTGDPNSLARGVLRLNYRSTPLTDLAVNLESPTGLQGALEAGSRTSFLITVSNRGRLASVVSDLHLGVCPATEAGQPADLQVCHDDATYDAIAELTLDVLTPGQIRTYPVTWTIPEDGSGRFHIVAEADVQSVVRDPVRDNNIDSIALDVFAPDLPFLRVVPGSLQVLRGDEPIHEAVEGDILRIEGTIENVGTADAVDAVVRLVNRFPMREERVSRLAPGESIQVETQWRAEPGNWLFLLQVIPAPGEEQGGGSESRAASWDLAVESRHIAMTLDPETMQAAPGSSHAAYLRLSATGSGSPTFVTRFLSSPNLTLEGLPARLTLPSGHVQEFPLSVTVSPFARAGAETVTVLLYTDPLAPPVAAAELAVDIIPAQPLSLHARSLVASPGANRILVDITNHGAQAATPALSFVAPIAWHVVDPAPITVGPGATRTAEAIVTIPQSARPGEHAIRVLVDDIEMAVARVSVLAAPVWQSTVEHVAAADGQREVWIRIQNHGNGPGLPVLELLGLAGPANVEPPLRVLQAGEAAIFRVFLDDGVDIVLPGQMGAAVLPGTGEAGEVRVTRWELRSGGAIIEGAPIRLHVEILNTASSPDPAYPVVVFANGFPAAETTVSLPASGVGTAELAWSARSGDYAVSVSHGRFAQETALDTIITVEPREEEAPNASLAILIGLLALAAIARRRRA